MFELGFSELLLTGIVALVVLGPERLPKVARTAGQWLGKIRRFAADMKGEFGRQIEAAELREVKDGVESAVRGVQESLPDMQMPAWERLPPQRTPADFGIDDTGGAGQGGVRPQRARPPLHPAPPRHEPPPRPAPAFPSLPAAARAPQRPSEKVVPTKPTWPHLRVC